ncbi:MAG TPA: TerB family tellurite resistance protein [Pirellulaceae bacterium]|nr:TerB family tellurite resistance protein [Pirellulaceae bacterium]
MENETSGYMCPFCHKRPLATVATAPYVRGFIVAYQIGSKTLVGCVPCVRGRLLGEAALSLFIGWFSFVAVFLNPILILYNVVRAITVGKDVNSVKKKLVELGLPESPQSVNVSAVGSALAACMVWADGKVEEVVLEVAERAGRDAFPDFDAAAFHVLVEQVQTLPPPDQLAMLLRDALDTPSREKVMVYLAEIAMADGGVSEAERQMLENVGQALGVTVP